MIPKLAFLAAFALLAGCTHNSDARIEALEQELQARDVEIARLRQQLKSAAPSAVADAAPAATPPPASPLPGLAVASGAETEEASVEQDARALQEALVQRGALLLPRGQVQLEPETSYFYANLDGDRRDTIRAALTARVGLPWSAQAEVRIPVVLHDHLANHGSSSGLGDIVIGLSKELLAERESLPGIVLTGRYLFDSGRQTRPFPTGFGAEAFQGQLTLSKSHEPVVLIGGLGYTIVGDGKHVDYGNILSGHFGAYLAATPATSLFAVVSANSNEFDRIDGERIPGSSQVYGLMELGFTTILRRNLYLNMSGGAGFGSNAPDLVILVSLPMRL